MAKVVFSGPRYSISPAFFSGFGDDLVVYIKWQICFCLKSCQGLKIKVISDIPLGIFGDTHGFHGTQARDIGVCKDANLDRNNE
jgi:hypothetical protein